MFRAFDPDLDGRLGLAEYMAMTLFLRSASATFTAFDTQRQNRISLDFNQVCGIFFLHTAEIECICWKPAGSTSKLHNGACSIGCSSQSEVGSCSFTRPDCPSCSLQCNLEGASFDELPSVIGLFQNCLLTCGLKAWCNDWAVFRHTMLIRLSCGSFMCCGDITSLSGAPAVHLRVRKLTMTVWRRWSLGAQQKSLGTLRSGLAKLSGCPLCWRCA